MQLVRHVTNEVVEDAVDGRNKVEGVVDEVAEDAVGHHEEHDILHGGKGARRVDALANLDELHQHEETQDGMGNGDDPGLIKVLYHAIRLGCSEKLVERPGNEPRIKRLVDDTEIGVEERGSDLEKPRFNHVGDIKEVPDDTRVGRMGNEEHECAGGEERERAHKTNLSPAQGNRLRLLPLCGL